MSFRDWYFIGFLLTVVAACILWTLAYLVYRNNSREYLHRVLSFAMILMGLWIMSGFVEKILPNPSNTFTLWTYRWAYAAGGLSATALLLFSLGLYLDRAPGKTAHRAIALTGAACAALSLTPYVISSASYSHGHQSSTVGVLFPLVGAVILLQCLASVFLMIKKWAGATGLERARTGMVLYGFAIFVPAIIVSIFVVPAVAGNDVSSNYAFLAGLVPVGFMSYAIVRLRLLDTRVIVRKTTVFLVGTVLLSLPVLLLFLLFRSINLSITAQYVSLLVVFMITMMFSQDLWKHINSFASRVFFSGLYDELELLEDISSVLLAGDSDPKDCMLRALSEMMGPLGLDGISVYVPAGFIDENCWRFICRLDIDDSLDTRVDDQSNHMEWLSDARQTVVTEELQRWPRDADEVLLGRRLANNMLAVCVPMKKGPDDAGYLLVGDKVSKRAFSSNDISFLEKAAEQFTLFLDNYALSTKLGQQLEELHEVYADLHRAYDFKSEIIQVASHEFRTPITVIDGFLKTLMGNWDKFSDEEKVDHMNSITGASRRLINLTDKFLSISRLEEGEVSFVKVPTKLSCIIQDLCSHLREDDLQRLIIEGNPEMYIVTDPNHLQVIMGNLVENALHFSPVTSPVVLRIWRDSSVNYIQVQDFGKGIPIEEREKVFEPFVRLETVAHHSRGMGLGLHIVRLLSSRLGVEVEIEDGHGGGTSITISFGAE